MNNPTEVYLLLILILVFGLYAEKMKYSDKFKYTLKKLKKKLIKFTYTIRRIIK